MTTIPDYDPAAAHDPAAGTTPEGKSHLFDLAGKRFYIDSVIAPNVAFKYLRDVRRNGSEAALANVIVTAIGEEALDALADADDMSPEEARSLMGIIRKHVMGELEKHLGK